MSSLVEMSGIVMSQSAWLPVAARLASYYIWLKLQLKSILAIFIIIAHTLLRLLASRHNEV